MDTGDIGFMRVILLGSADRLGVREAVETFRPEIVKHCTIVAEDFSCTLDFSQYEADFAIVFGGDGSILRAAHQMGENQLPVLSVNLGTLGFLANFMPEDLVPLLKKKAILTYPREESIMFKCEIFCGKELLTKRFGLNEVSIQTGPPFNMLLMDLIIDGEHVTSYRGDGLIISTPVGSTGHSLSAGGPILRNDLDVFVISPISPHTLSHRPVVDSAHRSYELRVQNPNVPVIIDGNVIATVTPNERVVVTRASHTFKMIKIPGVSYYQTLREKLGWSGHFPTFQKLK